MSSPAETVDQVFQWLRKVFGIYLPTLPLPPLYDRLASLFGITIAAPLPEPTDPLPWDVPLADEWPLPMPGVNVSLKDIRIHVAECPAAAGTDEHAAAGDTAFPRTAPTKE